MIVTRLPKLRSVGARPAAIALLAFVTTAVASCGSNQVAPPQPDPSSTGRTSIVARGRALYTTDGCAGCHSLNGTRITGPSWLGLAGSRVTLSDGKTVLASAAYLAKHINDPDAYTVRGYPSGVMAQAIESLGLSRLPGDVAALVAFIEALHR